MNWYVYSSGLDTDNPPQLTTEQVVALIKNKTIGKNAQVMRSDDPNKSWIKITDTDFTKTFASLQQLELQQKADQKTQRQAEKSAARAQRQAEKSAAQAQRQADKTAAQARQQTEPSATNTRRSTRDSTTNRYFKLFRDSFYGASSPYAIGNERYPNLTQYLAIMDTLIRVFFAIVQIAVIIAVVFSIVTGSYFIVSNPFGYYEQIKIETTKTQWNNETVDFDDGVAEDFNVVSGVWTIVNDRYVSNNRNGRSLVTARIGVGLPVNTELSSVIRFVRTDGYQSNGGLVFDYQNARNFKYILGSVEDRRWTMGEVVNGNDRALITKNATLSQTQDYEVAVVIEGAKVTLFVDKVKTITWTFSGNLRGALGLTGVHSKAQFDDIVIPSPDTVVIVTTRDGPHHPSTFLLGLGNIVTGIVGGIISYLVLLWWRLLSLASLEMIHVFIDNESNTRKALER